MEDYFTDRIDDLCVRVKKAMRELPDPVRTCREEFFAIDNLWRIEIRSTCEQAVEYFRSVGLLIDEGLNRPAAALSRSIHECRIRFHYLANNEDELPAWFKWQISYDYHAILDFLCHYSAQSSADEEAYRRLQQELKDVEDFLGEVPSKPTFPWKSPRSMLQDVSNSLGPEAYRPLYRQLIANPSEYVHIYVSGDPSWSTVLQLSEISFVAIIKRAMQLCANKQLIVPSAGEIEALCDQCYRVTQPHLDPVDFG